MSSSAIQKASLIKRSSIDESPNSASSQGMKKSRSQTSVHFEDDQQGKTTLVQGSKSQSAIDDRCKGCTNNQDGDETTGRGCSFIDDTNRNILQFATSSAMLDYLFERNNLCNKSEEDLSMEDDDGIFGGLIGTAANAVLGAASVALNYAFDDYYDFGEEPRRKKDLEGRMNDFIREELASHVSNLVAGSSKFSEPTKNATSQTTLQGGRLQINGKIGNPNIAISRTREASPIKFDANSQTIREVNVVDSVVSVGNTSQTIEPPLTKFDADVQTPRQVNIVAPVVSKTSQTRDFSPTKFDADVQTFPKVKAVAPILSVSSASQTRGLSPSKDVDIQTPPINAVVPIASVSNASQTREPSPTKDANVQTPHVVVPTVSSTIQTREPSPSKDANVQTIPEVNQVVPTVSSTSQTREPSPTKYDINIQTPYEAVASTFSTTKINPSKDANAQTTPEVNEHDGVPTYSTSEEFDEPPLVTNVPKDPNAALSNPKETFNVDRENKTLESPSHDNATNLHSATQKRNEPSTHTWSPKDSINPICREASTDEIITTINIKMKEDIIPNDPTKPGSTKIGEFSFSPKGKLEIDGKVVVVDQGGEGSGGGTLESYCHQLEELVAALETIAEDYRKLKNASSESEDDEDREVVMTVKKEKKHHSSHSEQDPKS